MAVSIRTGLNSRKNWAIGTKKTDDPNPPTVPAISGRNARKRNNTVLNMYQIYAGRLTFVISICDDNHNQPSLAAVLLLLMLEGSYCPRSILS